MALIAASVLFQGIPNGGRFKRVSELALVCTSLIFTCTVQHAAVNFSQYEEYAFPANYPILLSGEPPTDKVRGYVQYNAIQILFASSSIYMRIRACDLLFCHSQTFAS